MIANPDFMKGETNMDVQTKFNIGDTFYYIVSTQYTGRKDCEACDGSGNILLKNGSTHYCPECFGKGYEETFGEENWRIINNDPNQPHYGRPVGKIEIEVTTYKRKLQIETKYFPKDMGNYYKEEDCFHTIEEAQRECDKRNQINP